VATLTGGIYSCLLGNPDSAGGEGILGFRWRAFWGTSARR